MNRLLAFFDYDPALNYRFLFQCYVGLTCLSALFAFLQFALEVEGIEYRRLESSSPGIDRPLRSEREFERFAGELVDITLKAPLGAAAAGSSVSANRKKFRGTLERAEAGGWQITWSEEPPRKPGQRVSKKKEPAPLQVLGFQLDELREARLASVVDFKGRAPKSVAGES